MSEGKIAELGLDDAVSRRKVLVKELLTYRLSLDPNDVKTEGGPAGLRRKLREVDRRIAILQAKK
jgi:hypothetical protein